MFNPFHKETKWEKFKANLPGGKKSNAEFIRCGNIAKDNVIAGLAGAVGAALGSFLMAKVLPKETNA